jgi:hypothetical protein
MREEETRPNPYLCPVCEQLLGHYLDCPVRPRLNM